MGKKKTVRDNSVNLEAIPYTSESIMDIIPETGRVYMMNNNFGRFIPRMEDGLKPVELRLLYTMFTRGLKPTARPQKAADVTAGTMGTFHPHGDDAIYGTASRLAQWWKTPIPIIEISGGAGSQYGNPAASKRYTNLILTPFAWSAFFEDFNINDVPTVMNYTGDVPIPEYLPTRYPMVLLLGIFGIGIGMQSMLPTYNFDEVIKLTVSMLENPDMDTSKVTLLPDAPTYSDIIEDTPFREITQTGRGRIIYRGKVIVDRANNRILITDIPPLVDMGQVEKDIHRLRDNNILPKPTSIQPDSGLSPHGAATLELKFKKEIDLDEVRTIIMKRNAFISKTMNVNFKLIKNYKDTHYNIISYIKDWIILRRDQKMTYFLKRLIKLTTRRLELAIILEIFVGENAEKTIKLIRKANNAEEIKNYLMKNFNITSIQATSIANMRFSDMSKERLAKYQEEFSTMDERIAKLEAIVHNPAEVDSVIRDELLAGLAKFSMPRRSNIIKGDEDHDVSVHTVIVSHNGMIKKLKQKMSTVGAFEEGDFPTHIINVDNDKAILLFDSRGNAHRIHASKIRSTELDEVGTPITDYVTPQGRICAVHHQPDDTIAGNSEGFSKGDMYITFLTKKGNIKRTAAREYASNRSTLVAVKLADGDELVDVKMTLGDPDIIVYTEQGRGVRYNSLEIPITGRVTQGVNGINLESPTLEDYALGMVVITSREQKYMTVFTAKGNVKKSTLARFATSKRQAKPLRITQLTKGDSVLKLIITEGHEVFDIYMKNEHRELNSKDIKTLTRLAHPEKLIPVRRGDTIIDVKVQ